MKTYRAPGVYSKFIPSTEAVTGSSPIRKMAIVGTGQRFFNVSNQPIKRGNDKIYPSPLSLSVFYVYFSKIHSDIHLKVV